MKKFTFSFISFLLCYTATRAQTLYGTTFHGGSNGTGTLAKFVPATNNLESAYSFGDFANAPMYTNLLEASDGKLYGMTSKGGSNDLGIIFSFDRASFTYAKLVDFNGTNGATPDGSLVQASDGKLYGMTSMGGSAGLGVIFSLDPVTSVFTKLKDFDLASGGTPHGSLVQADNGKLYGLLSGGAPGGIFSFDPATLAYVKLMSFVGPNGLNPLGDLIQASDGKLYGMTYLGGTTGAGVIFSFDPVSLLYTKLKDFESGSGANPAGSLMQASDGKLYGMTSVITGGSRGGGSGIIFSFDPVDSVYQRLKDFDELNGAQPFGNLTQGADGKLFGMTLFGGITGDGVIFSFDPASLAYKKLRDFQSNGGKQPHGSLLQSSDGKFYGLTSLGGIHDLGVIFSFDPSNSAYVWKDFSDGDGRNPSGGLVKAKDGKLYGTTSLGGSNGRGTIYSFDPINSVYTKLNDFIDSNGTTPSYTLMEATDGKLYGTTLFGGNNDLGVIFSFDPLSSTYTKLKDFDLIDGAEPRGSLVQASNGKLYGTTNRGGANGSGVIFSFDPATATYTNLKNLDDINGGSPYGSLTLASDGILYGMAYKGTGSSGNGLGVIFSFNTSTSAYTRLKEFTGPDGAYPAGSLLQASDGKLYGVTGQGGIGEAGVIFSFDISSSVFTKLTDLDSSNGSQPGTLMQASDGKLYGVTWDGGAANKGVIFSYDPLSSAYTKLKDFEGLNGAYPNIGAALIELPDCTNSKRYYKDADGDGYGNPNLFETACQKPQGFVIDSTDCNDNNEAIHGPAKYYKDGDGDGYGSPADSLMACVQPAGYVTNNIDCDDNNKDSHAPVIYYRDADHDGLGDQNVAISACSSTAPRGYVKNNYDCNDHSRVHRVWNEKVLMCHNGETTCVFLREVLIRLWQGWKLGPCPANCNSQLSKTVVGDKTGKTEMQMEDRGVKGQSIPKQFKVSSYPNPFKGTSTIQFELPYDSKVSVKVYDLMGRALATLVDENKKAGNYTIRFNAGKISSGSLYYRVIATSKEHEFEQTNKMLLIR